MDEEFDDELDEEYEARLPVEHRASKWMVLGSFLELLTDVCKALAKFFDALTDEALSKYRRQRNKDEFIQQASREIEMLTSGDYDATTIQTSGRIGSWSDEQTD